MLAQLIVISYENILLTVLFNVKMLYSLSGTFYQVYRHYTGGKHNHSQNLHCFLNHCAKTYSIFLQFEDTTLSMVTGFIFLWTQCSKVLYSIERQQTHVDFGHVITV